MNKKHTINISRKKWRLMIRTFWIVGVIIFAIFNSTFFIPTKYMMTSGYASIGLLLVGIGLGLVYARVFKIGGIDK